MRSRINLTSAAEETTIDMTPMLDVVFIMLIFFIVSTTFVQEQGVQINSPSSSLGSEPKSKGMIITIDDEGQIWYDQKEISQAQIANTLVPKLAETTALSVLIRADQNTPTGDLIHLLDEVRGLGVKQVAVATKKSE